MTSPTERSLAECRKRNWPAQVVERFCVYSKRRIDLFGCIDLIAITPTGILGIQACAGASHAARRDKILAEPRMRAWVAAAGRLELWSWSKRGQRGARKLWALRTQDFRAEDFECATREPIASGEVSA